MRSANILLKLTSILGLCFLTSSLSAQGFTYIDVLRAIANSDLQQIMTYKNANPDYFKAVARPILPPAAEIGDPNIIRLLISNGADVNARNSAGETPLHVAAEWCDYAIIEILCQSGASVNPQYQKEDDTFITPMMTVEAMHSVYTMRNMSAGRKERHGVTRTITLSDVQRSINVLTKYGGKIFVR